MKIHSGNTGKDGYSGNRYSGNDGYSGLNPPDDAILFTVSGTTAIADKKLEILIKKSRFFCCHSADPLVFDENAIIVCILVFFLYALPVYTNFCCCNAFKVIGITKFKARED